MTEDILKLKVERIKWEIPDTATFYLSSVEGNLIPYIAGQFITLIFNHRQEEIRRSYSLSSSPDDPYLAITIKRITNGEISRFMLARIKEGDVLNALAPAGRFIISDYQQQKDIFLFAGGSGIIPFFSQMKYVLNREGKSRLILIYSNQNAGSILFKDELDRLAAEYPERLTIIHLLSSEANRLNTDKVEQLVKQHARFNLSDAEFYLCGPFAYMRMIRFGLIYMGIDQAKIRRENFVLETVAVASGYTSFPPKNIKIKYRGELHDIVVGENQSILQAALQNKILLPYSCRGGVCSTCMMKCTGGKVEMVKNDVLTEEYLEQGWVLTCTGHPLDDGVVVEL